MPFPFTLAPADVSACAERTLFSLVFRPLRETIVQLARTALSSNEELPMTTERIDISPAVMMGKPVIRGTRITVELLLRKLAEGASETDLLQDYPHLTTEDIRAAVAYGAASVAHEEVVLLPGAPPTSNS